MGLVYLVFFLSMSKVSFVLCSMSITNHWHKNNTRIIPYCRRGTGVRINGKIPAVKPYCNIDLQDTTDTLNFAYPLKAGDAVRPVNYGPATVVGAMDRVIQSSFQIHMVQAMPVLESATWYFTGPPSWTHDHKLSACFGWLVWMRQDSPGLFDLMKQMSNF